MRYIIMQNGNPINAIEADEAFIVEYCTENGYDFQKDPLPEPPAPDPAPSEPSAEADLMQMLLDQEYRLTLLEPSAGTAEI